MGGRVDREIREEMLTHIELRARDNEATGMSSAQARRDAELRFGDLDQLIRSGREQKLGKDPLGRFPDRVSQGARTHLMTDLLRDIRFAFRMMAKSPGTTAVAVVSLALGIGFNTTMFAVVDAVLFKGIPLRDPDRVIRVAATDRDPQFIVGGILTSYPDYEDIRDQSESYSGLASFRTEMTTLNHQGDAQFIFGESITYNFFSVLGIDPLIGRTSTADEDVPGNHRVAMLSESLWRSRFAGDPSALGREIYLGGKPYTLVGVVPAKYQGGVPPIAVHFWVPGPATADLIPAAASRLTRRTSNSSYTVGRLADGVSLEQANAELAGISQALAEEYPDTNKDVVFGAMSFNDVRIDPRADRMMLPVAGVVMSIVGLVLLIACANVASMMLARASMRRQEIAVRQALGAGRGRVLRQMLTESTVLSMIGGALAVGVAFWTLKALLAIQPPIVVPIDLAIGMAPRVFAFTLLLALGTGFVFGLAPALQTTRSGVSGTLRGDEVDGAGRVRGQRMRNLLVGLQVAVSIVLLVSSALLVRSLISAQSIDPGIRTNSIVSIGLGLVFQGYNPEDGRTLHFEVMEKVAGIPGVESVAFAERLPLDSMTVLNDTLHLDGLPSEEGVPPVTVDTGAVTPEFFDIMGIDMVAGRRFDARDVDGAPMVAIVNQAMADKVWPGEDPIGKRFSRSLAEDAPIFEVIGVNATHKVRTLGEDSQPHVYFDYRQNLSSGLGTIIARSQRDPAQLLEAMRHEVTASRPELAIMSTRTIQEHLSLSLFPVRLAAMALSVLGMLGALLASVGVYGVVAFAVARRRREIGIRMAVGADRNNVVRMVFQQGMRTVLIGGAIGLLAALAFTRALTSILYGIGATDVLAYSAGVGFLLVVAVVANALPAWRAAGVNPVSALRSD